MAHLDSADLAIRVKMRLNRPTTDEMFTVTTTDDVIYVALTDSQDEEIKFFAARVPSAMYASPVQLTTADAGKTWTFPSGIVALGHFKLYTNLASIPDWPLIEGVDYTVEDTNIRIPGNASRTFENGLGPWALYVAPGGVIAAATQPTIPEVCRQAVVSGACARLAGERLKQDPSLYLMQRDSDRMEALVALRTRSFGAGGHTLTTRLRYGTGRRWL